MSKPVAVSAEAAEMRSAFAAVGRSSVPADRAAERLRHGGVDRATGEKRIESVAQVRRADLRGNAPVITELAVMVHKEDFRRAPCIQQPGEAAFGIPDDRKRVSVLACMRPNVVFGLPTVAVNADEQNALLSVLGRHLLEELVVEVGVRTERRSKDDDDRLMVPSQIGQGKGRSLNGRPVKARNGASDLEAGRAGGEQERENGGAKEVADEPYSVEASDVADLRTKLRMTRLGEKPKLIPKVSAGSTEWTLLPQTIVWYEAKTSTVPVRA